MSFQLSGGGTGQSFQLLHSAPFLRLKFFWHRPSWAAVEEQSADPETAADPKHKLIEFMESRFSTIS